VSECETEPNGESVKEQEQLQIDLEINQGEIEVTVRVLKNEVD
jgi:hypothetical protein